MSLDRKIEEAVRDSIDYLATVLDVELLSAPTHQTVIVSGWDANDSTVQSIARYLVGLRACAIDAALTICARLENTVGDRIEIVNDVISVVGKDSADLTESQRTYERNPWIAEAIWHLCMMIAAKRLPQIHPPGTVIALNYPHPIAKGHGLDVAAIYDTDDGRLYGLSFVESKAYKIDVNGAISEAVGFFREINEGKKHGMRIRQTVQIMRSSLVLATCLIRRPNRPRSA